MLALIFIVFKASYPQDDSYNALKHLKVGKRFFENGDYTYAIAEFEKALNCDSSLQDARFLMGISYLALAKKEDVKDSSLIEEKLNQAAKYLKEVIFYNEKYEPAYIYLAEIYLLQKKYDPAEELLKNFLKDDSFTFKSEYALGVVFYKKGKLDESISYWEKALEKNKDYAPLYYNLAFGFYNKGESKKALEYIENAVKLDKKDSYFYLKGKLLLKLETNNEANEVFNDIIASFPTSPFAKLSNAQILIRSGKMDDAFKAVEGINTEEANLVIGYIYYKQGKFEQALMHFKKTLEVDPLCLEAKQYLNKIETLEKIKKNEENMKRTTE